MLLKNPTQQSLEQVPPRFLIIAGPNGAGKSTLAETYAEGLQYINGDEIKRAYKEETKQSIDQFSLRNLIKIRIDSYIRKRESFAMESNLVSNYSYEIVQDLPSKGYQTELLYIGVNDLDTLNQRIQQRVLLGKHYIPPKDVEQRYQEALQKLPSNLKLFDVASIFDNSVADANPVELMQLRNGVIVSQQDKLPQWLLDKHSIIEKLSKAYQKLRGIN
jgi:predicted ABC-type ATPase